MVWYLPNWPRFFFFNNLDIDHGGTRRLQTSDMDGFLMRLWKLIELHDQTNHELLRVTIKTEERSHTVSIAISSAQVVLQGLVLVCLTSSVEMQLGTNFIGGSTIYKTRNPVNWTS